MPVPYDRKTLENMKRSDLQKICKDHGIKANLKSEALVDLLLDTQQPPKPVNRAPEPKRASSLRVVSRSTTGSRMRSGGTVIVHDTDEEEDQLAGSNEEQEPAPLEASAVPTSRTRKAKETQYRLGVGRPVTAGGTGPRAITKSVSVSREKRIKGSRSVKPSEEAIREEDEELDDAAEAGPSNSTITGSSMQTATVDVPPVSEGVSEQVKSHVSQVIHPLQDHIRTLQADLQQATIQSAEVPAMKAKVDALIAEVESLRAQVTLTNELRAEVAMLRGTMSAMNISRENDAYSRTQSEKSAGKARATDGGSGLSPDSKTIQPSSSTLGKRQRDSPDSNIVDAEQPHAYSEKELGKKGLRPTKKRVKLSRDDQATSSLQHHTPEREDIGDIDEDGVIITPAPPAPPFTVFSGPEEPPEMYIDPPLPDTRLSDLFVIPSSGSTPPSGNGTGPVTSTANGTENTQQSSTFSFSFTNPAFHPVTSTPAAPYGMTSPSFYAEPPISPTPGAADPSGGYIERAGGRRERNDLFNPHGGPRRPRSAAGPSRPRSRQSRTTTPAVENGCVEPSALLRTPTTLSTVPEMDSMTTPPASSNEVGVGLGMSGIPETPALPMKRTMYGTELEGDTRFGDFGVEGVATGFWTGTAPRF
ncbi:predicted protein [Sparassis crispa]|uniref:SAP domain-containing protein n=1 Tax=Sparassis crispa TaxID=139825 RepID=A0A401G828_9APHY|nr:predicted protein [Sparassis crispa]GBE78298.1 predicted protein [Sparassis crispa]